MNECTESTGPWPDEPADVSPDEQDAFLAHVKVCHFHAEKLRAEEEELRSMFRLARGLDSHGRILRGRELNKKIEEHEQRHALWSDAAQRKELPFKRIYLSNCGEVIASSGKFYDFRRYEGDHPLDPQAGLQIWGVIADDGRFEEVLLGFYPLAGVHHTGEEKVLPLENGFSVGLIVEQLAERIFNVQFRCVENEVLEKERATKCCLKEKRKKPAARASSAGHSALQPHVTRSKVTSPSQPRSTKWDGMDWTALAAMFFFCCAFSTFMYSLFNDKRDNLLRTTTTAVDPKLTGSVSATDTRLSSAITEKESTSTSAEPAEDLGGKLRQSVYFKPQTITGNGQKEDKSSPNGSSKVQESPGAKSKGKDGVTETDSRRAAPTSSSKSDSGPQTATLGLKPQKVWRLRSFLDSSAMAERRIVIHTGNDLMLRQELFDEIYKLDVDVDELGSQLVDASVLPTFTVDWSITRQKKSVTVKAVVTVNGVSEPFSFPGSGTCLEQACKKAVADAVTRVFAIMQSRSARGATSVDVQISEGS